MPSEERTHNCGKILGRGKTLCDLFTLICWCQCRSLYDIQVNIQHVEELGSDETRTEMKWLGPKRKKNTPVCDGMPAEICKLFIAVKRGNDILTKKFNKIKKRGFFRIGNFK